MKISRRNFLKTTSSSLAFGRWPPGQAMLRPIAGSSPKQRLGLLRAYPTGGRPAVAICFIARWDAPKKRSRLLVWEDSTSESRSFRMPTSINIVRSAIDRGVTFLDNCWDYNGGTSEIRMGKALRDGYRQKVFLMTKIDGRTKEEAERQLDESLKRLQTDHIDLLQHHEVIRPEDPDRIFGDGGAQEAMLEARKAGKIRYIGFTGHKDPFIHLRMLEMAEEQ